MSNIANKTGTCVEKIETQNFQFFSALGSKTRPVPRRTYEGACLWPVDVSQLDHELGCWAIQPSSNTASTLRITSGPAQIFWKWITHSSTRTSLFLPRLKLVHLSCYHGWNWLRLATPLGLTQLRRATRIFLAGNGLNAARACLAKIGTTMSIRFA